MSKKWLIAAAFIGAFTESTAALGAQPGSSGVTNAALVRPGDIVRLRIWREPDLSGEFPVNDEGAVVLPMLGRVVVTSFTPDSLRAVVLGLFEQYLRNPSIEVTVLRRLGVTGAVARPGLYPVDASMTVADLVMAAGGIAPGGDEKKIELRRDGVTIVKGVPRLAKLQDLAMRSGDEFNVGTKPWIVRNFRETLAVAGLLTALVVSVSR